jgi:hypothetical protein
MQWTKELPTAEGYYWIRNYECNLSPYEEDNETIAIALSDDGPSMVECVMWAHDESTFLYYISGYGAYAESIEGEFYGPLQAPE